MESGVGPGIEGMEVDEDEVVEEANPAAAGGKRKAERGTGGEKRKGKSAKTRRVSTRAHDVTENGLTSEHGPAAGSSKAPEVPATTPVAGSSSAPMDFQFEEKDYLLDEGK